MNDPRLDDVIRNIHNVLRVKWRDATGLSEEIFKLFRTLPGEESPEDTQIPPPSEGAAEVQRRFEEARKSLVTNIDNSVTMPRTTAPVVRPEVPWQGPDAINPPQSGQPKGWEPDRTIEFPVFMPANAPFISTPPVPVHFVAPAPAPIPQPFITSPVVTPPLGAIAAAAAPIMAAPVLPAAALTAPFLTSPYPTHMPFAYSRPDLPIRKLPDAEMVIPVPHVPIPGGAGGGGGLLGKVQSGSGKAYTVTTYSNGPNSAPDTPDVLVRIPELADGEDIPDDTWISPILQVTNDAGVIEFWYVPPTWVD
jgi:hypothetical protein